MNPERLASYNKERAIFSGLDTNLYNAIKTNLHLKDPKAFEEAMEAWAKKREEVIDAYNEFMAEQLANQETEVE